MGDIVISKFQKNGLIGAISLQQYPPIPPFPNAN